MTFLYLVLAEIVLLAGAGVLLLLHQRRKNRLRPRFPIAPEQHPRAACQQYHMLVQNEINKAENRLHSLLASDSQDQQQLAVIRFRTAFLSEEQKAVEAHGHDEQTLWQVFSQTLPPLMPDRPVSFDEEISADIDSIDPEEYRLLQRKLQATELRADNLAKFKDLFFDLKSQFAESQRINDALHDELEELLPDDFASEDLKAVLAKLRSENTTLHHQLEDVESSFVKLTRNLKDLTDHPIDLSGKPHTIEQTSAAINAGVQKIKGAMEHQDEKIRELSSAVVKLKLKVEQQQSLEEKLTNLQNSNDNFKRSVANLEEENAFLADQISALLKQEVDSESKHHKRILQLESEITEKEMAVAEMEAKYTRLELDFQKLYADYKLLKDDCKIQAKG